MPDRQGKDYIWSAPDRIAALSKEPFGKDLMQRVAERLQKGERPLCNRHREYCGHGLFFEDGKIQLVEVQDGDPRNDILSWDTAEAFVDFWAKQSDYTCSGADSASSAFFTEDPFDLNNQRITKERLEKFAQA